MEKEGNVGIKVKHIGMLKKILKFFFFYHINLIKRNQKNEQNFSYLKNRFRHKS